jgi:hypothetical protein
MPSFQIGNNFFDNSNKQPKYVSKVAPPESPCASNMSHSYNSEVFSDDGKSPAKNGIYYNGGGESKLEEGKAAKGGYHNLHRGAGGENMQSRRREGENLNNEDVDPMSVESSNN